MSAYYNETNEWCIDRLETLIARGLIPDGEVDPRSIEDVQPDDLRGFTQCHFFAGIGGWPRAFRLAGWPDDRFVWSGSCPCGPFSLAGKMEGFADERHLWPAWVRLIEKRRPAVVFGEQVASATAWVRLMHGDMEALDYAVGAIPIEAACAGAYHLRDRFWFVADAKNESFRGGRTERGGALGDGVEPRLEGQPGHGDRAAGRQPNEAGSVAAPGDELGAVEWVIGPDERVRPIKPGLRLLADEVPERMDKLMALGNAIDPECCAEFIRSYMDVAA